MYWERGCKNCWENFEAKKLWQFCCSKRCYLILVKKKRKIKKEENKNSFPDFKCPKCWDVTKLNFNPIFNIKEWKNFKCWCWYTRNWDITY